ncbi:MAG: hypothetical protein M1524_04260 [Patescibacteria group bacterium]|nr:hypothetical protein [Patescibacteria group bacterium]
MENQQINQNQEIVQTQTISSEINKPPRNFPLKFMLIFIGISFLIAFVAGGFMLGNYKTQKKSVSPTPTAKIYPSVSPITTANWKNYDAQKFGFSFKYPSGFSLTELPDDAAVIINHNIVFYKQLGNIPADQCKGDCPIITNKKDMIINGYKTVKYNGYTGAVGGNIPQSYIKYEVQDPKTKNIFSITLYELPILDDTKQAEQYSADRKIGEINESDKKILDQILSTFKFTAENRGVVCAMDAKQCPDGSWVGREGPNCEFKPCP